MPGNRLVQRLRERAQALRRARPRELRVVREHVDDLDVALVVARLGLVLAVLHGDEEREQVRVVVLHALHVLADQRLHARDERAVAAEVGDIAHARLVLLGHLVLLGQIEAVPLRVCAKEREEDGSYIDVYIIFDHNVVL